MQTTPRRTRSTVLGKRSHQSDSPSPSKPAPCDDAADTFVLTPDSSPCAKRPRTSLTLFDPTGNKENIPPFDDDSLLSSPSSSRALRRTNSEFSTPTRPRTMSRRHGSMSSVLPPQTPSSALAFLAIQTPPATPTVTLPLHARARALLRSTCNSSGSIAGRVSESQVVRDFLASFIRNVKAVKSITPVLYLSGSPGCGKTALVNSILSEFSGEMSDNSIDLLVVNCMALNGLDAVWDRLFAELGGQKKRGKKSSMSEQVEDFFAKRRSRCVLVLDEIDHVAASSQTLLKLFSLAQNHTSTLRVIGIANTHTLTSSASQMSLHGVSGVKTLHFAPYEPSQLLDILHTRLLPLSDSAVADELVKKFLPHPTLKLLSMKIAAQTGDVRAVFEVLRGAIDIAVAQCAASKDVTPPVTPSHIQAALKAYSPASRIGPTATNPGPSKSQGSSELTLKVRNLGLHSRLALLALLLACKRVEAGLLVAGSGTSSITPPRSPTKRTTSATASTSSSDTCIDVSQLHTFYSAILTRGNNEIFTPVSRSEFSDLIGVLETVGLVTLPSSSMASPTKRKLSRSSSFAGTANKASKGQEITFAEGIRATEILRGMGLSLDASDASPADAREEEASAIWERELSRIRKESKILPKKGAAGVTTFEGSTED
ncbi:P-loop containing nucleoside triphosphate hydrolase protein [Amylostereum chailletii]|nr:P-loop containing nucleoside triphosphate hydrolase protein [Amylostereum chailletii]